VPLEVKMKVDAVPESVERHAGIGPDNYVDDAHLPHIVALLSVPPKAQPVINGSHLK
jgi:hypothetical protein